MHTKEVKSILSTNNGMNLYRGCLHGCIYCDARSDCYQMEHDFEDIEVKINAPELLEKALKSKRKKCMIGTGAMSDPYLPLEEKFRLTRQCLQVIDKYGFGLAIQTKSDRILEDLDLIKSINSKSKVVVQMTMTTFDEELCKKIEPNVCTTKRRFEVLKIMRDEGIETLVWLSPFLPFINDTKENVQGLLDYCVEAEVKAILCFGIGVTLRSGDREHFYQELDKKFKGVKQLYQQKYGNSYDCASPRNKQLMQLIYNTCKEHNIIFGVDECFKYLFEYKEKNQPTQLSLFD